ncbi:MAG: hypothetical protein KC505_02675 [Myxococcales bacterium]|nr:hypothetical protein [Myxococcales bacterium]USN50269.1 MAG: hypothetical protein H6731_08350 [Myxococcales bacterium]
MFTKYSVFILSIIFSLVLSANERILYQLPAKKDNFIINFAVKDNTIVLIHSHSIAVSYDGGTTFSNHQLGQSYRHQPDQPYLLQHWDNYLIHISDDEKIFISRNGSLFLKETQEQEFIKCQFNKSDEKISSIVTHGHYVFVTFGPFHHICEWNNIALSQDGGKNFSRSASFGSMYDSYSQLEINDEVLYVKGSNRIFKSSDWGTTFVETTEHDLGWKNIIEKKQIEKETFIMRFSQEENPEGFFYPKNYPTCFSISYINYDFHACTPLNGIKYVFPYKGKQIEKYANDTPRYASFHNNKLYLASTTTLSVVSAE